VTVSYLPLTAPALSAVDDSAPSGQSSLEITAAGEPSPLFRFEERAAAAAAATRRHWLLAQLVVFGGALGLLAYEAGWQLDPGPAPAVASTSLRRDVEAVTGAISRHSRDEAQLSAGGQAPDRWRVAASPIAPELDAHETFLGMASERLRLRMQGGQIKSLKKNRGGSSISLRVEFADGSRAAFKPVQSNPQTVPRKEAAAYALSRLLGLNLVAPVVLRSVHRDELFAKLDPASLPARPRIERETHFDENGKTLGAFSYWIPRVANPQLDTTAGILRWTDWLGAGGTVPPEKKLVLSQLSSLLVFDLLQNNSDRFSGGNLLGSPDGQTLYYMDNAFGFQVDPEGHTRCWFYLNRVQKFSLRLLQALERLRPEDLRAAMVWSDDSGATHPLLSDEEQAALLARRDRALAHIYQAINTHGRDRVLVFD